MVEDFPIDTQKQPMRKIDPSKNSGPILRTTQKKKLRKIKVKTGHHPVKHNARRMQKKRWKQIGQKFPKPGHLENVKHVDIDCFVSSVILTFKNDKF